ncbi:MAG: AAA family ATPase, partial [Pelagibacterales bacterium]|nr:AAA family ATPase [Pelagibacterales bacterium]
VRNIDVDYQKKFGKDDFYIDHYKKFELYPDKPKIIEKKKINIQIEINNLNDLLSLTEKYPLKFDVEYNINMEAIHNIKIPIEKLNNMIGMNKLKESILDQIIYFIQDLHINSEGDFMHTVIAGPPGTGKTEIAKIMGEIFSNLGILKKKTFKKVTRSDLIAGYLGQTALKTTEVIKEALGGVLFIDEAYALGNEQKRDSFAKECIDTLCEALSSHKDNLMVIVAGYEKDLNKCFFSYNKGLDSRFTWRFTTDDYNSKELNLIFKKKIKDISWKNEKIKDTWFDKNMKYFSFFGRDMETLLAKVKIAHSRRVFCLSNDKKKYITLDDLNRGFEMFLNNDEVKNRNQTSIIDHMYC